MSSSKPIEGGIKKRAKSQRLKKSFEALLKPEPKSERKSSPEVKITNSHNNIKFKKDKPAKLLESETVKIKAKGVKSKNKELKFVNSCTANDELKNSVSQDIKSTVVYKNKIAAKDKVIEEQQQQIEDLKAELHHLRDRLDSIRAHSGQMEQQISEIKSEKGERRVEYQKKQEEMEGMVEYIEELKSQLLAQKLQKQEYLTATKNLMMIREKGASKSAKVLKDIFLRKVKTALGRCFVHIGQVAKTNKSDNPREVEKLLYQLPQKIEEQFNRELNA